MNTHETTSDIIAEMRGMGNYQRYSGDHARVLANRLEAAQKRERGDAAKLREALALIATIEFPHNFQNERFDIADACQDLTNAIKTACAALAAPPRNCDVMDWRTAWKIWREKFHPETPVGYSAVVKGTEAFMDWFAAPATEQEGGNDGNE